MLQQAAKYVLKKLGHAMSGKEVKGIYSYLTQITDLVEKRCKIQSIEDMDNLDALEEMMKVRSAVQVAAVA